MTGGLVHIDGSRGEGGGQIVRTALSLAACTGRAVAITNVRARRRRPGLQPQHLAAVRAMQDICEAAAVEGAALGSQRLLFRPGRVRAGHYRFDIGTAGSTLLVLQTVLPALLGAEGTSELELIGGTHNPLAPTFEFVDESFLPLLAGLGADTQLAIERYGFYPRGGGRLRAVVRGPTKWRPLALAERGPITRCSTEVLLAHLPEHVAARELDVLCHRLGIPPERASYRQVDAPSPGNVVIVRLVSDSLRQTLVELGARGRTAEAVAGALADRVQRQLRIPVPIDEHLADQLLVPLALAGGGSFVTVQPSSHTLTNAAVIEAFLPLEVGGERIDTDRWRMRVVSARTPAGTCAAHRSLP